ncbi:MAG: hypothetical protein DME19_20610 [Verrucomicrobia bacterium]|nr:MAG: hypothetical protein DME19_20610 [Verrucomicrobiota bacterium]
MALATVCVRPPMSTPLPRFWRQALFGALMFSFCAITNRLVAADTNDLARELRQLKEENRALKEQLRQQSEAVKRLTERLNHLERARESPQDASADAAAADRSTQPGLLTRGLSSEKLVLSGEGGLAFFHQDSQGQFHNAEFRVDEAKLFLDAKVWKDVYVFAEVNLITREQDEQYLELGELYVDFENVSGLWGQDRLLNLRAGRIDIPFGEEYLARDAIDNPLISHSLSDLWGVDEGVELYGRWKPLQYILAAQNGGHPLLNDGDADKAVVGRLAYEPARWLHLSASAMRTGHLDVQKDQFSELWFGNGFIRQIGAPATTTKFHAELLEGDAQLFWRRGHLKSAGGWLRFDDNDPTTDHRRNLHYYYVEAVQGMNEKLYGAVRWSQIFAPKGFPLVGAGDFGSRLFGNLTEGLWRLTLGAGYRWSRDLVFKVEYSLNQGRELGGTPRDHEDLVAAEVAVRF